MRFFSGKGDEGKSSLVDGKRLFKNETVFELIGTLDELTANLGLAISLCEKDGLKGDLRNIQKELSGLMGFIAGAKGPGGGSLIDFEGSIKWVEQKVEEYGTCKGGFVLAGQTTLGAALDISRTVARRAERIAVRKSRESIGIDGNVLVLLNRLSTLLFHMRLFVDQN